MNAEQLLTMIDEYAQAVLDGYVEANSDYHSPLYAKLRASVQDIFDDTERIDWLSKTHKDNVVCIAGSWYSRPNHNSRHKKHSSLREAIDYARVEKDS